MTKRTKILCTGSGGFIMGNFIRQAFHKKKPYIISSIDNVRESHLIHNIYVNQDHNFHIADLQDKHILHTIFQKERPDIVIHGAQEKSSDISSMINSNITGTQNIIDECLDINAKLMYVSDYRLYSINPSDDPANTNSQTYPNDPYTITKIAAESLIQTSPNLFSAIVRLDDNYGPWQSSKSFIPKTIKSIINNEDVVIYNQGSECRSYTHVFDTTAAMMMLIDNWQQGVFNITAHQEFSALEVFGFICNSLVKKHDKVKFQEKDIVQRMAIKDTELRSMGWKPELKLRDGIEQTCQWYISNKYVFNL